MTAKEFKSIRAQLELKQYELGKKLGIRASRTCRYENGMSRIPEDVATKLLHLQQLDTYARSLNKFIKSKEGKAAVRLALTRTEVAIKQLHESCEAYRTFLDDEVTI
jgi:transcriptional regulator with XRE-family HTH domain